MTDNATIKTVEHGDASRLPEANWFWRRWLIYGATVAAIGILSFTVQAVVDQIPPDIGTYRLIIRYSFYTIWTAVVLYGVGATVTDVSGFVAALKTTRKETITTAPPVGTVTSPDGTTATTGGDATTGELPADQRVRL